MEQVKIKNWELSRIIVDLQMDIETLNSKLRIKAHEKEVNERTNAINRNKKIS